MKKITIYILSLFIYCLELTDSVYAKPIMQTQTQSEANPEALSTAQTNVIQALLDDTCRISGVPGMSVSIRSKDEVFYFSSGYADRENGMPASENSLYELASVSKALTGVGVLLLEEQGLLLMNDSIQKYLPWFTLKYRGKPVDMQNVTLNHFLHHTSGLVNSRHTKDIPQGNTPDMLRKTVETLTDAELAFMPGEKYTYGTVNYDVLGLVMEVVSGQSYEDFMAEQVFQPLGLYHTYVYKEDASAAGELAQGYRTSFFGRCPMMRRIMPEINSPATSFPAQKICRAGWVLQLYCVWSLCL